MKFVYRFGPALIWAGLIFYLSSIPHLQVTDEPVGNFLTRKLAHLVEYSVLYLLILRAFEFKRPLVAAALALSYALSDEIHQSLVPSRTPMATDIIFDLGGAVLGWSLWKYYLAARLKPKS